ncbi:MAG: hypothetical protein K5876_03355 [Ruminiclostridium sp.]|nr:hypothetical protein [Ruminiclostridium sp.]
MAKRCTKCGNFLMDDERFCTRCGENVSNIAPDQPQYVNASGQANYQQQPGAPVPPPPQYNYAQPVAKPKEEMSLGSWVGVIIVTTFFGIISLIFLFVWGFGDGPECRKNYCKAMLIVEAISIGLAIIAMIVFGGIFGVIMSSLTDYIGRNGGYRYGQGTMAIMQMFGIM